MPEDIMDYIMYPISRTVLGKEMARAVDAYTKKQITAKQLQDLIYFWRENSATLLFAEDAPSEIAAPIVRYLGKKRLLAVQSVLSTAKNN